MADYLYKTILYKNTDNVIGLDVEQNDTDLEDFETNHKANSQSVSEVQIGNITFILYEDFQTFDSLITGDITWADVKYVETSNKYTLNLLVASPL